MILLSLVLVLAAVVVGAILTLRYFDQRAEERAEAERQAKIEGHRTATTAHAEEFVTALGDHDAAAALALSIEDVESPALTDEMLAATYPDGVSDVTSEVISELSESPSQVDVRVSYSSGDAEYSYPLTLLRDGSSDWVIQEVTAPMWFPYEIDMTVNGVNVGSEQEIAAFPGSYAATPTNKFLHAPDAAPIELQSPAAFGEWDGQIVLTDEAINQYRAAGKASLEECLNQKALAPDGCPWQIREENNIKVDTSTLEYTAEGPDWDSITPTWNNRFNTADGFVTFELQVTATATQDGNRGTTETELTAGGPLFGDLSGDTVTVTWNDR